MADSTSVMRAVIAAPDTALRMASLPLPEPGNGEVRVRVAASGVNPLDLKIHAGQAPHARHPLPAILGLDLAGTIDALGQDVSRFRVGDEVYGMIGGVGGIAGTLAEYAIADADLLARKPDALSMRDAAALPLVTITAWLGLVDRMGVSGGDTVLVQGGAGGVGHVAIQLARAWGATVFATGSTHAREEIERLGARFIDRAEPVADYAGRLTGGVGFDRVYDTAGGTALDASFAAVREEGRVVSCLGWGTHALAPLSFRNASYAGVFALAPLLSGIGRRRFGDILTKAASLAEAGGLRATIDSRRFDLTTVGDAHALHAARESRGKLVVEVN